ncbi:MAG: WD40/YVTN/BNR-like repeat-containing protein [Archangium sp.]
MPGGTPSAPDASDTHPPQGGPDGGSRQDEPPPDAFRPAFHQTLSGSTQVAQRTTYRFRIPLGRAGTRLRFNFQAGEGPLKLHQATVARADAGGALASAPVALSFQGSPGANAQAHGVLRSDPVFLPVDFRQELAISFEVEGAVATGGADLFPQSYMATGSFSQSMQGFGQPQARLVGLSTVEVEGEPGRCVAVVGGGAGVSGASGDVRETWPAVAERLLGMPVLDLAGDLEEKGQGLTLLRQCREVACVVLPGAEEVAGHSAQELQASLSSIFTKLRPVCDVYAGTLPPSVGPAATCRAVNDWVKAQLPAGRVIDFAQAVGDEDSTSAPARMGNEVALGLKGSPISELGGALSLEVTYQDSEHEIMAMDPDGTVYALKVGDSRGRLWASTDNARSWAARGTHPGDGGFLKMTSLKDGTLLATVYTSKGFVLSRSTDHGATWEEVLPLGNFRMLQPHSIRELHGTVFFLEYQTFTDTSPIRLWVSTDQGATWRVRYTVQGRRHGHSLVADPEQGVLWAMMGDLHGGLLRSVDEGVTWRPVVDGPSGVAVDGVVTPRGLLWGSDNLYGPPMAGIRLVAREDSMTEVAGLPGPSYSILHLPEGGYVLGTTRETGGDVYAPGDVSAHVLYSADGTTWKDFRDFPRLSEDDYVRADVYWQLPSGEVVLELINSKELGPAGYMLLKAVRK